LVPKPEEGTPESAAAYPMALRFTDASLGQQLDRRRFDIEPSPDNRSVTFRLELPGIAVIRKTFSLDERPYVVTVQVSYENLEPATRVLGMDDTPAFYLDWKPNVASGDLKKGVQQAVSWYKNGSLESLDTVKLKPGAEGAQFTETIPDPAWIAIRSAYFIVALKPDFDKTRAEIQGVQEKFRAGLSVPRFEVRPGETAAYAFTTYLGPSHLPALKSAWPTLDAVLRFFETFDSMDWFAKLLLTLLVWFHDHVIANYGMAIIFLTVLVRLVMYPLTLKSMKSMKKMQLLAPEMEAIKKQYGDDPQVQQQKIMEMYKERGVNPLGGCFPMLLQMPVFIALYRMLWSAFELRGAPFYWWVTDLSEPDSLFRIPGVEQIPFLSAFGYLNILPILMGVAMVISQKLMPASGPAQNPQQKFIMTFMPIFFSFICYSMPSGLNLYILTSTILGIVQQQFTSVGDINAEPKKKTPRKRQHFYTAAMARKRRLAKETRQDRKGKRPDKN
jgi:YidC/Oxa1 family membrane protein insertase